MISKQFAKRRKDSAVSPVIATILMVAITVVLAAVLYVMVGGVHTQPRDGAERGIDRAAEHKQQLDHYYLQYLRF